jgi:hypothetical protein
MKQFKYQFFNYVVYFTTMYTNKKNIFDSLAFRVKLNIIQSFSFIALDFVDLLV